MEFSANNVRFLVCLHVLILILEQELHGTNHQLVMTFECRFPLSLEEIPGESGVAILATPNRNNSINLRFPGFMDILFSRFNDEFENNLSREIEKCHHMSFQSKTYMKVFTKPLSVATYRVSA